MKFDRTAPGGSVETICRLENGKAILDWEFHLVKYVGKQEIKVPIPQKSEEERSLLLDENGYIRLTLADRQDTLVLECIQKLCEEEPLQSVLLQPELWRGIRNPYLYSMEAILVDERGNIQDRVQGQLALRCLQSCDKGGKKEFLLNHEPFEAKMVHYALPDTGTGAEIQRRMLEDLQWMRKLGANCVCIDGCGKDYTSVFLEECMEQCSKAGKECFVESSEDSKAEKECFAESSEEAGRKSGLNISLKTSAETFQKADIEKVRRFFLQLCDRSGFLVFERNEKQSGNIRETGWKAGFEISTEEIISFRGNRNSLFLHGSSCPTSLFFKHQAKWSDVPFVHIVPESVQRLESGNFTALCYSNCDRVALYSDGVLFEFKSGEGEFFFREIPSKTPSIMLTAEGEGCSHSLSLHKSFTK